MSNQYSRSKIARIAAKTDWHCWYCGREVRRYGIGVSHAETLHLEHSTPRSDGGDNSDDNLVPACGTCNTSKQTKDVERYRFSCMLKDLGIVEFSDAQIDALVTILGFDLYESVRVMYRKKHGCDMRFYGEDC